MFAPIAALLLTIGAYSTPAMVVSEQQYVKQHPHVQVEDIQASTVVNHAPQLGALVR